MADLFAVVGIISAALLITACWFEVRGRPERKYGTRRGRRSPSSPRGR